MRKEKLGQSAEKIRTAAPSGAGDKDGKFVAPSKSSNAFRAAKAAAGKLGGTAMVRKPVKRTSDSTDTPAPPARRPGRLAGRIEIAASFFEPMSESELREFEGS